MAKTKQDTQERSAEQIVASATVGRLLLRGHERLLARERKARRKAKLKIP